MVEVYDKNTNTILEVKLGNDGLIYGSAKLAETPGKMAEYPCYFNHFSCPSVSETRTTVNFNWLYKV